MTKTTETSNLFSGQMIACSSKMIVFTHGSSLPTFESFTTTFLIRHGIDITALGHRDRHFRTSRDVRLVYSSYPLRLPSFYFPLNRSPVFPCLLALTDAMWDQKTRERRAKGSSPLIIAAEPEANRPIEESSDRRKESGQSRRLVLRKGVTTVSKLHLGPSDIAVNADRILISFKSCFPRLALSSVTSRDEAASYGRASVL